MSRYLTWRESVISGDSPVPGDSLRISLSVLASSSCPFCNDIFEDILVEYQSVDSFDRLLGHQSADE